MVKRKENMVYFDDDKFTITKYTNGVFKVFSKVEKKIIFESRSLKEAKKSMLPPVDEPMVESDKSKKKKKPKE